MNTENKLVNYANENKLNTQNLYNRNTKLVFLQKE